MPCLRKYNRDVIYTLVGKGCSKKRMPYCNDKDRFYNPIWKNADLELVFNKYLFLYVIKVGF